MRYTARLSLTERQARELMLTADMYRRHRQPAVSTSHNLLYASLDEALDTAPDTQRSPQSDPVVTPRVDVATEGYDTIGELYRDLGGEG